MSNQPTAFTPEELALIMSLAYVTMTLIKDHPDRMDEMLDPEEGLTQELFEQVLSKLSLMRLVAGLLKAGVIEEPNDAGVDLASIEPAGNA